MTTVRFRTEGEPRSPALTSAGHSGYAEEGEDIVCAAITSAIRLVEATVNDVLGLAAAGEASMSGTTKISASGSPAGSPPAPRAPVRPS